MTPSPSPSSAPSSAPSPGPDPEPTGVAVVLTAVPDAAVADRIARALVDERLAACVSVLGAARSTYRWQGEVESADELPLLIKTTAGRLGALTARLVALHPYQVPEVLVLAVGAGLPAYLDWVREQVAPQP
jgi:periplasmic divalent cation tolerance protein